MSVLKVLLTASTLLASASLGVAGTLHMAPAELQQAEAAFKLRAGLPVNRLPGGGVTLPAGTYTFTLDAFKITNTRSLHEDTDFASIAVSVGGGTPITVPAKAMGDLNNGAYQVGLSIPNVTVQAGQAVDFSYSIVNSGFAANSLEQDLRKLASQAAQKAGGAGAAALAALATDDPNAASIADKIGQSAGGWAGGKLIDIIFADCDGTVAAADHVFSGAQLAKQTAGGVTLARTDNNPGTDSPTGCGSNSQYFASWSVHPSNVQESLPGNVVSGGGGGGGVGSGGHHQQN